MMEALGLIRRFQLQFHGMTEEINVSYEAMFPTNYFVMMAFFTITVVVKNTHMW